MTPDIIYISLEGDYSKRKMRETWSPFIPKKGNYIKYLRQDALLGILERDKDKYKDSDYTVGVLQGIINIIKSF